MTITAQIVFEGCAFYEPVLVTAHPLAPDVVFNECYFGGPPHEDLPRLLITYSRYGRFLFTESPQYTVTNNLFGMMQASDQF